MACARDGVKVVTPRLKMTQVDASVYVYERCNRVVAEEFEPPSGVTLNSGFTSLSIMHQISSECLTTMYNVDLEPVNL